MKMHETDDKLVEKLREDGRASYEALAAWSGLSRKVARARVQRLFGEGVLRVVATVSPGYDDIHAIAYLSVSVSGSRREEVARALAESSEIAFVSIVSGQANVVAEIRTHDLLHICAIVDQIRASAGVTRVETTIYADVLKEPHLPPPPTTNSDQAIDETDRTLIALLREDGRTSYADLAAQVDLSAAATRARVRNLLDRGVIRIVTLINPTKLGRSFMTGFAVDLNRPADAVLPQLSGIGAIDFLARTLGAVDAVGTIVTTTNKDTIDVLDEIAALQGVTAVRSWTHLRLMKERYAQPGPN